MTKYLRNRECGKRVREEYERVQSFKNQEEFILDFVDYCAQTVHENNTKARLHAENGEAERVNFHLNDNGFWFDLLRSQITNGNDVLRQHNATGAYPRAVEGHAYTAQKTIELYSVSLDKLTRLQAAIDREIRLVLEYAGPPQ